MAREAHYAEGDPRVLLAELGGLRARTIALLEGLTPEQWARTGRHAVEDNVTVAELLIGMAGHDRLHLEQLRAVLECS